MEDLNKEMLKGIWVGIVMMTGVVVALVGLAWKLFSQKIEEMKEDIERHDEMCADVIAISTRQEHFTSLLETVIRSSNEQAIAFERIVALHRRFDELVTRLEKKGVI